jgi:predicted Rossmann fold nucleotide-binding protein DprA/Smf involved in DNA uptake
MIPTADAQVLLLLCSQLGLPAQADPTHLTLREWNPLARKVQASSLARPGALLGLAAPDLQAALDLPPADADRLARLLDRSRVLAIELERLASLGIWVVTRADVEYPQRFRQRLRESAPAVLFGAGEAALPGQPGLAVVGSRNVNEAGQALAGFIGNACARCGLVLYSGGARGVDTMATQAALEARGTAVGILADSLEKAIRAPEARAALARRDLALVTPYAPNAGFSVGAAMGRNRLIYALADYALVVASDEGKGGTWAGAVEALRARWIPVFAADGPGVPEGNRRLLEKGALPFPLQFLDPTLSLRSWLESHATDVGTPPTQARLF